MNTREENTGKSIASRFKHQFVYVLIALGGRGLAYLFLYPLVFCYCLYPSVRAKSRAYLTRRLGACNKWKLFKHTFRLNLTFGRCLVDRAALGITGKAQFISSPQMRQKCEDLVAQGKGVIMLTAHVGCWQSAVNCMQFLHKPMHVLYYRNPKDNDKLVAEHKGGETPFTLINPAGPLGGVPEMMSALRRGEAPPVRQARGWPKRSVVPFRPHRAASCLRASAASRHRAYARRSRGTPSPGTRSQTPAGIAQSRLPGQAPTRQGARRRTSRAGTCRQ